MITKPTIGSKNIARQLKKWREANDLSQSQAAGKLQVSTRTLQEWKQERRHPRGLALNALLNVIQKAA